MNDYEQCKKELEEARQQAKDSARLLIRQDIDLMEVNDELRKLNDAKTEFVALAAHQLRTPITTINWYTEYLTVNRDRLTNEQVEDYLKQINETSKHMADLIDVLLMMSNLELETQIRKEEEIDFDDLSADLLYDHRTVIEQKGINFDFSTNVEKTIITDPEILKSIFQNLISNAIKYTSEKDEVKVDVAIHKQDTVFGGRTLHEDVLGILVSDTGIGIPDSQKDNIFQRLFRADNVLDKSIKGIGLGLYIVKLMVEQLSGTIWFDSKEEIGTTFYVTIPLHIVT